MKPIISIISPSFQHAKYLAEAIESVINQVGEFYIDYQIRDGGSSDGSLEILQKYEARFTASDQTEEIDGLKYFLPTPNNGVRCLGVSYRWVSEKDNGQAAAIDDALDLAKGEIFSYLNSDDVYEQGAFATIINEFSHNPEIDVVYGNAFYIDSNSKVTGMYPPMDINYKSIDETCVISQPSAFIRMQTVRKFGKFNPHIKNSLDYEYWLRLWHGGAKFKYIRPVLSSTRIHPDTKTNNNRLRINMESFAAVSQYNGGVPLKAKAEFAQEASIPGKLFSFTIRGMRLAQRVAMKLYAPLFYKAYQPKIEEVKSSTFSSH